MQQKIQTLSKPGLAVAKRLAVQRLLPKVTVIVSGRDTVQFELDVRITRFLPNEFFVIPKTIAVNELVWAAEKQGTPVAYQSAVRDSPLLFRDAAPARFPPYELARLSDRMIEGDSVYRESGLSGDNETIPAGFTYLTQFVNHDLLYKARQLGRPSDVEAIRQPRLNLDSLYGEAAKGGKSSYRSSRNGKKLSLGGIADGRALDLPRDARGIAKIPEPKNDNNFILAQLTALLMRFHNQLVDRFGLTFEDARKQVTLHYQSVVMNDLLPRLLNKATFDDVVARGPRIFEQRKRKFVPYEFSNAAFRLHTMTREKYRITSKRYLTLERILRFTGEGEGSIFPLDPSLVIDWSLFFPAAGGETNPLVNFSRPIDPYISPTLHDFILQGFDESTQRLLKMPFARPPTLGLVDVYTSNGLVPSAQSSLSWLREHGYVIPKLTPWQIGSGTLSKLRLSAFVVETPLFYYVLKEAEILERGRRLGPLGSRIVAETIIGLLRSDRSSILHNEDWKPLIPVTQKSKVAMSDIVAFVREARGR